MTSKKPTKGIIMFAHNNDEIDYLKLAVMNALLIQKNLGMTKEQIAIGTDEPSMAWTSKDIGKRLINSACKHIIYKEKDRDFKYANIRLYKDTNLSPKSLSFYNLDRCDAYDLSPFDETIVIDADYLILSNKLNDCWGHNEDIMMNWHYEDIMTDRTFESLDRVSPLGITMYWATVVYFKKCDYAETFFNFVKHVKDNREYYVDLYKIPGSIYRNDYSFSIAAHMLSGLKDKGLVQLPFPLYKSFDTDDLHSAESHDSMILFLEKIRSPGDFVLTKWKNVDLHIMNKWAINRISKEMLKHVTTATTTKTVNKKTTARKKKATAGSK